MSLQSLTTKQRLFIEAYIGKANGNATEAARIAGYSGNDNVLGVTGLRLLRNHKIATLVEERIDKAVMTADEVLKELAELAKMKWNTKGFRASDKIKALELVGKYHSLFSCRVEQPTAINESHTSITERTAQVLMDKYGWDREKAMEAVNVRLPQLESKLVRGESKQAPPLLKPSHISRGLFHDKTTSKSNATQGSLVGYTLQNIHCPHHRWQRSPGS